MSFPFLRDVFTGTDISVDAFDFSQHLEREVPVLLACRVPDEESAATLLFLLSRPPPSAAGFRPFAHDGRRRDLLRVRAAVS